MKEGKVTETQKKDLLSMMLYDRDEYFTDQLVKDSAFTFLTAGHETTATGLPGILMYLAKVFRNIILTSLVFTARQIGPDVLMLIVRLIMLRFYILDKFTNKEPKLVLRVGDSYN